MSEYTGAPVADAPETTAPETTPSESKAAPMPLSVHSEAGRRAAERVKHLVRLGHLFEQEHGLKRGRQRLRQLIQLGKRYELDHGLNPQPKRRPRRSKAWAEFVRALGHIVRPAYQSRVEHLAAAVLDAKAREPKHREINTP